MAASPPGTFNFPREYFFPPFFTRQTNLTTHHAQLTKWSALVLSYCRHYRIYKLTLSDAAGNSSNIGSSNGSIATTTSGQTTTTTTTPAPGADELFHNRKINRRLGVADVKEVMEFMRRDGRAEYVGGGSGATGGDVVWIYWRTPEEWAAVVEGWVEKTAQKGSVLTVYELTEGEGTRGAEFHGLDPELLLKALNILVKRGKAQIFGQDDSQGVKFF